MKFQIGDKVVLEHSQEEAEVVEIINDKMVMLDIRGVKFPAYTDQLDFPYFKRFMEKKVIPQPKTKKHIDHIPTEKSTHLTKLATGVWLSFLPLFDTDEFSDEYVHSLKIHLINQTAAGYCFRYKCSFLGSTDFELENEIPAFRDFYLHDIDFEKLNDSPVFSVDFTLMKPEKKRAPHAEVALKPKPKQVFSRIEALKKNGEATFSYLLFEKYPDAAEEEKPDIGILSSNYRVYDASQARKHLEPARQELDLHIEKLTGDWKHLSNFEILALQLQTFEKYFDLAVAHRLPSLVVIHGLGKGKLRDELHELLRLKKEVKSFVNQYDSRYGYGATEIFLQYK